ncbi:WD40 repeat domain-containing protein [Catenovulum sediminis]|uniref:Anaphase-promoting complex subunit 4-like WD40 domain-containing protein n=1 Tax=Catenovulum sediminis TaxID=1740262 RepID=A0ABV1RHW6_9ALTE
MALITKVDIRLTIQKTHNQLRNYFSALLALILLAACTDAPTEINRIEQTDNGAYAADLSQAGIYSVMSTQQGVSLWDLDKNLPKFVWQHKPNQQNRVHITKISDDSRFVLTAESNQFAIWNLQTGANRGFYQVEASQIMVADLANGGEKVALGLMDGRVLFINLQTGRRLEFLAHSERISALDITPNGNYVLSGSYDGSAYLWHTQSAQITRDLSLQGRISQLALDNKARYAFTANSTNQSIIWDLTTGQQHSKLRYIARQQIFTQVKFSHNGKLLATGAPNQKIKIWSVDNGQLIAEWHITSDHFAATVLDFAFTLNDQQLTASTSFGLLQTWDISQLIY